MKFFEKSPVIHLNHKETETFCQYYDLILSRLTNEPKHHLKEATDALLQAFLYEFHDTMERFVQLKPSTYSSNERLFKEFLETLTSTYPRPRMVTWYADRLHITPKYLSNIECGAKVPRLETFIAIANALEVDANTLLMDVLSVSSTIISSDISKKLAELSPQEQRKIKRLFDIMIEDENNHAR